MNFTFKKIKTKENPFFLENLSSPKKEKLRVFFGPTINQKNKFKTWPKKTTFFALFFSILSFFYLFFAFWQLLAPPKIIIFFPTDNLVITEKSITIKGKTEKGAMVFINEQPIINFSGQTFTETIILSPGLNLIKIAAKKRFSQEKVVWRQVIVQP